MVAWSVPVLALVTDSAPGSSWMVCWAGEYWRRARAPDDPPLPLPRAVSALLRDWRDEWKDLTRSITSYSVKFTRQSTVRYASIFMPAPIL